MQVKDVWIAREIANRKDLAPGHKLVLGEMITQQGGKNRFKASYDKIARPIGMSRRHVIRIIDDLVVRREVRRTFQGKEEANVFSVRFANNRNRRRSIAIENSAAKEVVTGCHP